MKFEPPRSLFTHMQSRFISELDRSTTVGMDIILQIWELDGQYHGIFEYRTDIFSEQAAQRMLSHLTNLLENLAAEPQAPIASLPIVSDKEMAFFRQEWHQVCYPQTRKETIIDLISAIARHSPDNIAVVNGNRNLTYMDLERKSNQLARVLRKAGAAPEMIIGISMEKSSDLIIAILAILKSGAAYLPLDPTLPENRLSSMASDANIQILLSDGNDNPEWAVNVPNILRKSAMTEAVELECSDALELTAAPDNLAYVIYTSGSTGRSKGVMVEHRSLTNAYYAWEDVYGLKSLEAHLQMASYSFDVFTGDMVRALCSGKKLVLCPREQLMAPEQLYRLIVEEGIDCAEFVPVVLRPLVEYIRKNELRLDTLKILICGSDSWFMEEYNTYLDVCGPQTRLINSYGVTEATIDTTWFESSRSDYPARHLVPVGKPFRNMRTYVLNSHLQPVPSGVSGELFIGGEGLARGYLNQAERTAERFILHDVVEGKPERLYRTGDPGSLSTGRKPRTAGAHRPPNQGSRIPR